MTTADQPAPGWRRGIANQVPWALPLLMRAVFAATTRRFGADRGYQAGFAVYWATCWALALTVVGPRRLGALWRPGDEPLPRPRAVAYAVLAVPPVGAVATQWLPNLRGAGSSAVAVAAWLGVTNATAEEALWRGVPVTVFPDDAVRGWLWPAVGFTAWHLVPLAARPTSPGRRNAVLLGAAVIGLAHGWVAHRTRSLALVTPVHALTDACGLRPAEEIWLGRGNRLPWARG